MAKHLSTPALDEAMKNSRQPSEAGGMEPSTPLKDKIREEIKWDKKWEIKEELRKELEKKEGAKLKEEAREELEEDEGQL